MTHSEITTAYRRPCGTGPTDCPTELAVLDRRPDTVPDQDQDGRYCVRPVTVTWYWCPSCELAVVACDEDGLIRNSYRLAEPARTEPSESV